MEACDMKRTSSRSHRSLAICVVMLMGCTSSNEQTSQDASAMSGIAMADQVCSLCHGLTGSPPHRCFPSWPDSKKST